MRRYKSAYAFFGNPKYSLRECKFKINKSRFARNGSIFMLFYEFYATRVVGTPKNYTRLTLALTSA